MSGSARPKLPFSRIFPRDSYFSVHFMSANMIHCSERCNSLDTEIRSPELNISDFYVNMSIIYEHCTEIEALTFHLLRVFLKKVNDIQMDGDNLHTYIRRLREGAGLSQGAMADELDIGRTTYINFETGRTKPFSRCMSLFAGFFGKSESDLIVESLGPGHGDGLLEQVSGDAEKIRRTLVDDYERKLSVLMDERDALRKRLENNEKIIKTLTETNAYLISQLSKND